ncbi:putative conserved hypothetical protein, partial [Colletotrichum sublineola]
MTPEEEVDMVRQSTEEAEEIPQEGQYEEEGIYAIRQGDAQEAKDTMDPYPVPRAYANIKQKHRACALDTAIIYFMTKAQHEDFAANQLWQQACDYLYEWKVEDYDSVDKEVLLKFCDFLIDNGIWIELNWRQVASRVYEALEADNIHVWTEEEIDKVARTNLRFEARTANPGFVDRLLGRRIRLSLRARQPPLTNLESTAEPETREQREDTQFQQASSYRNLSFKLPPLSSENSARASPTLITVMVKRSQDRESTAPTAQFNGGIVPSDGLTSRQLTDLIKLYSDDPTSKYTGGQYETI